MKIKSYTCYQIPAHGFFLLIMGILLMTASCNSEGGGSSFNIFKSNFVEEEEFKEALAAQIQLPDPTDSNYQMTMLTDIEANMSYAYQQNDFKPFWMDHRGVKPAVSQLLEEIQALQTEGINIQTDEIQPLIDILKTEKKISLDSLIAFDRQLSELYLTAAQTLLMGSSFTKKDNQWFIENDSSFFAPTYLVAAFANSDSFPSLDTFRSELPEYKLIVEEIKKWQNLSSDAEYMAAKQDLQSDSAIYVIVEKECAQEVVEGLDTLEDNQQKLISRFQSFYGLKKSGKLDDNTSKKMKQMPEEYIALLQMNLNRLRRLPRSLGDQYIWVNIPLMELDYVKNRQSQFHSRVIVGKVGRPTPSISSPMTNIVFNPPWGVPPTILRNDVGPGVARSGSGYLARKGLRAYDSRGRDVTSQVNASNYRKFFISQPPGAGNALGEIKFNMPNGEAIYIHDTPNRGLFKNANRALSSGCVRTENPKDLAELILGTDSFPQSRISSIISTRRTYSKDLDQKIPVFIVYLTVAPHSSGKGLRYLSDIYGRDKKMLKS